MTRPRQSEAVRCAILGRVVRVMARAMSEPGLVRTLAAAGVLPADAELLPRRRMARWCERGLRFEALVDRGRMGEVEWALFVSDGSVLGLEPSAGGVGATITVRAIGDRVRDGRLPWPERARLTDAELQFLRRELAEARGFVQDRADLCWLLTQESDVVRGSLFAWFYEGYPARLVKALTVARDLGDQDLADAATAVLRSGRSWSISPTQEEDILTVAGWHARDLGRVLGRPIEL